MPTSIHSVEEILRNNSPLEDVIMALYKLNPHDLAMLKANGNAEIQEKLDSDELKPFWENKFNKLRLEKNHTFQFRDPEPKSKADFYCGYVMYLVALKEKQKPTHNKYNEYLRLSLNFHSFYATQEVLTRFIVTCKNDIKKENLDAFYKYLAKNTLTQQETPDCLLIANAYYYLAGFYQSLNLKRDSANCYRACWEQLHLAELLEKSSECAIHNAYFDQGLSASNVFEVDSLSEIKEHCLEIASEALAFPIRKIAELNAERTFNKVAQKDNLDQGPSARISC